MCGRKSFLRGSAKGPHVLGVALRGVIGIFLFAMQGILSDARAETAFAGVHDRDANAVGSEIHSRDDVHEALFLPALSRDLPFESPLRLLRRDFLLCALRPACTSPNPGSLS